MEKTFSYFVVMIDYGKRGREAIVNPEITRREVISRIRSGDYRDIISIHHIDGMSVEDVTLELTEEADDVTVEQFEHAESLADRFDRARALRQEA